MKAPPHSVEPRPECIEVDVYADRNNFLMLLLGLIANAERMLEVIPGLAPEPPEAPPPAPPRKPIRSVLR